MNHKFILPLSDESPIRYDLKMAVPLMAVLACSNIATDAKNWIYSNYMQLVCRKRLSKIIKYNHFHIYDAQNIFVFRRFRIINQNDCQKQNILQDFLRYINEENYIYVKLDRYYLSNFTGYNENHILHTECIYGYDIIQRELYSVGFPNLSNGKLEKTIIKFDDFINALNSTIKIKKRIVVTLDMLNKEQKFEFNYNTVFQQLEYYVNSVLPIEHICETNKDKYTVLSWDFPINQIYGISAANRLTEMIPDLVKRKQFSRVRIMLQALLEFEELMFERLSFLYKNNCFTQESKHLIDSYKEIVKKYEIIRNIFIKYEYQQEPERLKKIQNLLYNNLNEEKEIISKLIYSESNIANTSKSKSFQKKLKKIFIRFRNVFYYYFYFSTKQILKSVWCILTDYKKDVKK